MGIHESVTQLPLEAEMDHDNALEEVPLYKRLERALEKELTLPRATFGALTKEDDWTNVVKCAVIAEAALGDALARFLTSQERGSLGDLVGLGKKIKAAKRHGLLDREQRDGLYELMTVRNICAHDRKGLSFTFDSYYKAYPSATPFSVLCRRIYTASQAKPGGSQRAMPDPATAGVALVVFVFVCCVQLLTAKRSDSTRLH
jgi:hypothetical protein